MDFNRLTKKIQKKQLKNDVPIFSLGDAVCVGVLIKEASRQRIQIYQGVLISQHRALRNSTITIRRVFQGIGVERVFFVHSSSIQFIEIRRHAKVCRSKLYYLRNIKGKAARLRERITKSL
jgi:large subunit ribosomal protein L19